MINKRCDLVTIIYKDLYLHGKIRLFLLLLIMITATLVIMITYQTRCIIINREKLFLEKNMLDLEWNKLILKRKKLSCHTRIEHIAINTLKMRYIDPFLDKIYE